MNTTARKNCVNFWNKMAESCLTSPPPPSALLCPWNLFSILLQPRSARPAKAAFNRKERRKKVGNAMGPASPGRELHFERIRIRRVGWSTRPPSWQTAEEFHFDSRPPQLLAAVSFVVKSDLIRIWSTPFPSLSLSLPPSLPSDLLLRYPNSEGQGREGSGSEVKVQRRGALTENPESELLFLLLSKRHCIHITR